MLASGEPRSASLLLENVHESFEKNDPLKLRTLRVLAVTLFASERTDEGAAVSRKVLRIDPTCISSMHNLSLAAVKNNRYASAWGWVTRGLRHDPLDNDLRRLRSRLIWEGIGKFCKKLLGKRS